MAEKHVHKVYGSFPPWGKSVEFPESGGGGGLELVCVDCSGASDDVKHNMRYYSCLAKGVDEIEGATIVTMGSGDPLNVYAYAYNPNLRLTGHGYNAEGVMALTTIGEMMSQDPTVNNLPRMTEEDFFNLNIFMFKDTILHFDEGMTWAEWCGSKYNTIGFYINGDRIWSTGGLIQYINDDDDTVDLMANGIVKSRCYFVTAD